MAPVITHSRVSLRVWIQVLFPEPALPLMRYTENGNSRGFISSGVSRDVKSLNQLTGGIFSFETDNPARSFIRVTIFRMPCIEVKLRYIEFEKSAWSL